MEIRIGSQSEGVLVALRHPQDIERSEGWIDAEVEVRAGAWRGHYAAQFLHDDLVAFAEGLCSLEEPGRQAILSSTDGYLDLQLTRDELGHVEVSGEAWDTPRWG